MLDAVGNHALFEPFRYKCWSTVRHQYFHQTKSCAFSGIVHGINSALLGQTFTITHGLHVLRKTSMSLFRLVHHIYERNTDFVFTTQACAECRIFKIRFVKVTGMMILYPYPTLVFHFVWIFADAYLRMASILGLSGHLSACLV
jgi:hypothetical protein